MHECHASKGQHILYLDFLEVCSQMGRIGKSTCHNWLHHLPSAFMKYACNLHAGEAASAHVQGQMRDHHITGMETGLQRAGPP